MLVVPVGDQLRHDPLHRVDGDGEADARLARLGLDDLRVDARGLALPDRAMARRSCRVDRRSGLDGITNEVPSSGLSMIRPQAADWTAGRSRGLGPRPGGDWPDGERTEMGPKVAKGGPGIRAQGVKGGGERWNPGFSNISHFLGLDGAQESGSQFCGFGAHPGLGPLWPGTKDWGWPNPGQRGQTGWNPPLGLPGETEVWVKFVGTRICGPPGVWACKRKARGNPGSPLSLGGGITGGALEKKFREGPNTLGEPGVFLGPTRNSAHTGGLG